MQACLLNPPLIRYRMVNDYSACSIGSVDDRRSISYQPHAGRAQHCMIMLIAVEHQLHAPSHRWSGFAGAPHMVTVLLATLAVTHTATVGLWVLAVLTILLVVGTDIGVPAIVAVTASAGAVALAVWKRFFDIRSVQRSGLKPGCGHSGASGDEESSSGISRLVRQYGNLHCIAAGCPRPRRDTRVYSCQCYDGQ